MKTNATNQRLKTLAFLTVSGCALALWFSSRGPTQPPIAASPHRVASPASVRAAAPLGSRPAPSTLQDATLAQAEREAAAVRATVVRYSEGRFNAFFEEEGVLPALEQASPRWTEVLRDALGDSAALEALPADIQFQRSRPKAVLERMSMIDLLNQAARTNPKARQALIEVVEHPIPTELPVHTKRALVAERYDVLFRLAQFDVQAAVSLFSSFPIAAQDVLRPALLSGLAEGGVSHAEAARLVGDMPVARASQ